MPGLRFWLRGDRLRRTTLRTRLRKGEQVKDCCQSCRLNLVPAGKEVTVISLDGGDCFMQRVASMGLRSGSRVRVLQGGVSGGPVLLAAGETRLAIGHGMAEKITVALSCAS